MLEQNRDLLSNCKEDDLLFYPSKEAARDREYRLKDDDALADLGYNSSQPIAVVVLAPDVWYCLVDEANKTYLRLEPVSVPFSYFVRNVGGLISNAYERNKNVLQNISPFELQMYRNAKSLIGRKKPMDRDASIFMFGMEKATPLLIVVPERFLRYELLNHRGEAYVTDVESAQRTKSVGEFLHEVYEKNKRNLCGIRADELQLYCSKEAYQRKETPLLPSSLLHVDVTCQAKAIIVPPRTIWSHVIDVVEADYCDYDDDDVETTQLDGSVRTVGRLLKLLCKKLHPSFVKLVSKRTR